MMARVRVARVLLLPMVAVLGWLVGFVWFVDAGRQPAEPPPPADGIVVLTGGAERVEAGLHLLAGGGAGQLLISGVGHAADFRELARRAHVDLALAPRVTLGRAAESTHGNALETAEWAASHNIRTLIVVTAGYHMPRALAELRGSLPDVTLYPLPVHPQAKQAFGSQQPTDAGSWSSLRTLAGEYSKFLAVQLGITNIAERII